MDGLYHQKFRYPPETMLSTHVLRDAHGGVLRLLPRQDAGAGRPAQRRPPQAGGVGAAGQAEGRHHQNIDGLHQKAGSRKVLELHGSVLRNHCTRCGQFYGVERIVNSRGVPRCSCGGIIKPDVVLYEESLDEDVMAEAILHPAGGHAHHRRTSLVVYPAAGLVQYYRGHKLAVINKGGRQAAAWAPPSRWMHPSDRSWLSCNCSTARRPAKRRGSVSPQGVFRAKCGFFRFPLDIFQNRATFALILQTAMKGTSSASRPRQESRRWVKADGAGAAKITPGIRLKAQSR